jgi:hypothetical protein
MVREDRVIVSVKELMRVSVIRQTMEKNQPHVKAGALLGLTPRHIRHLIERVAQASDLLAPGPSSAGHVDAAQYGVLARHAVMTLPT